MIHKDEPMIAICKFNEAGEICFTAEYLELMKDVGGARAFASRLISWWEGEGMGSLLDYFGPDDEENDKYSGIDGEGMDVRGDICDLMEYKDLCCAGLDSEWHRDLLRAKLVSIRLPVKLVKAYVKAAKKANQ